MTFTISQTDQDLLQILSLQKSNLPQALTSDEISREGFVTVSHSFESLKKMNSYEHHVIAKEKDQVVAYLLAMTEKSKEDIPILVPMFDVFNDIVFRGKKIASYHYLVVGQVCVAKEFRGRGVLDLCYAEYKKRFEGKYDFAITEISKKNPRSLKAHQRIGFKVVHEYHDSFGVDWDIVLWDWK